MVVLDRTRLLLLARPTQCHVGKLKDAWCSGSGEGTAQLLVVA